MDLDQELSGTRGTYGVSLTGSTLSILGTGSTLPDLTHLKPPLGENTLYVTDSTLSLPETGSTLPDMIHLNPPWDRIHST